MSYDKKTDGIKITSLRCQKSLLAKLDQMKKFYEYKSKNDLLIAILENAYKTYLGEKDNKKTLGDRVKELEDRMKFLELQAFGETETDKSQPEKKQERIEPVKTNQMNYEPEAIQEIIVDMKSRGFPSREIADNLISKGYTTMKNKKIHSDWVDKQVHKLKRDNLL